MGKKRIIGIIAIILIIISAILIDQTMEYGTPEQVRYSSSGTQLIEKAKELIFNIGED